MRRTLVELLHIAIGLVAAALFAWAASWAYPLGREVIWWCGGGAMVVTVVMGMGPLGRAIVADRGRA